MATTQLSDLDKFKILFDMPFKTLKDKVEYRVDDLDVKLNLAKEIIKNNKFELVAECQEYMASMKSFVVRSED